MRDERTNVEGVGGAGAVRPRVGTTGIPLFDGQTTDVCRPRKTPQTPSPLSLSPTWKKRMYKLKYKPSLVSSLEKALHEKRDRIMSPTLQGRRDGPRLHLHPHLHAFFGASWLCPYLSSRATRKQESSAVFSKDPRRSRPGSRRSRQYPRHSSPSLRNPKPSRRSRQRPAETCAGCSR